MLLYLGTDNVHVPVQAEKVPSAGGEPPAATLHCTAYGCLGQASHRSMIVACRNLSFSLCTPVLTALSIAAAYDTGYGSTYDPTAWGQNGHTQTASTSSAWDGGAKSAYTSPPVVKAVGADEVS